MQVENKFHSSIK